MFHYQLLSINFMLQMKASGSPTRPTGTTTHPNSATSSPDEKTPLMVVNVDKEQKV